MAPEEEAEIHPRTGYISWSDAKQACINAEESYRDDIPDADCARVRAKGSSRHSELPSFWVAHIGAMTVSRISVVSKSEYLPYL